VSRATNSGPATQTITYDDTTADNDLSENNTKVKAEMDYVLARENGCPLDVKRTRHIFKRSGWDAPTTTSRIATP